MLDIFLLFFGIIIFFISGLVYIARYEVGIRTKKMFGAKMPQGQIIARNGEIGIQANTLMPGLYWYNPITWKIEKEQVTVVTETEIGTPLNLLMVSRSRRAGCSEMLLNATSSRTQKLSLRMAA